MILEVFSPKILQNNCQCDLRGLDHFLGLPKFPKIGFTGLQHQYSPIFGIYVHLDQWNWHFCGVLPSTKVRTTFRVTLESQEQFLGLPKKFDSSVWMIDVISYMWNILQNCCQSDFGGLDHILGLPKPS